MAGQKITNLVQILELYQHKRVPRSSSNEYRDDKDHVIYARRETNAEHIYSSLRLADLLLTTEPEFAELNRLLVYEILLYHDDPELITGDQSIAERAERAGKEDRELTAMHELARNLPAGINDKLVSLFGIYTAQQIPEARFARAIDKLDALVHELQYPGDWGPKGFTEVRVREWFGPAFIYSRTLSEYFESILTHLHANEYFATGDLHSDVPRMLGAE